MQIERTRIEQAARATGIDIDDLAAFFAEGEERIYAPGEWLFQESTPRRWAGILTTLSKSFRVITQSLILGLGALLVLRQELSPGMMIAGVPRVTSVIRERWP